MSKARMQSLEMLVRAKIALSNPKYDSRYLYALIYFLEDFLTPKTKEQTKQDYISPDLLVENLRNYGEMMGYYFDIDEKAQVLSDDSFRKQLWESLSQLLTNTLYRKEVTLPSENLSEEEQLDRARLFYKQMNGDYGKVIEDLINRQTKNSSVYLFSPTPVKNEKLYNVLTKNPIVKIHNTENYFSNYVLVHEMQHQIDDRLGLCQDRFLSELMAHYSELSFHHYNRERNQYFKETFLARRKRSYSISKLIKELKYYEIVFEELVTNGVAFEKVDIIEHFIKNPEKSYAIFNMKSYQMTKLFNYLFSYFLATYYIEEGYSLQEMEKVAKGKYKTDILPLTSSWRLKNSHSEEVGEISSEMILKIPSILKTSIR